MDRIVSFGEAKDKGLKFYYTGKPCKRGHLSVRLASSCSCVECKRIAVKQWRAANPEKNLQLGRAQIARNREKIRAQERQRYAKNPEKHKEKVKRQYKKNSEAIRRRRREYHYKVYQNPEVRAVAAERTRQWAKDHPDIARANARNGKAKRKSATGKHTSTDISEILKMQGGRCAYCRTSLGKKYHVDHILALSRGGTNDRKNIQITCGPCNLRKGASDPIIFSRQLGMLL